jgi:hypothetical protein
MVWGVSPFSCPSWPEQITRRQGSLVGHRQLVHPPSHRRPVNGRACFGGSLRQVGYVLRERLAHRARAKPKLVAARTQLDFWTRACSPPKWRNLLAWVVEWIFHSDKLENLVRNSTLSLFGISLFKSYSLAACT